ncbi:c-type cytochrome [Candidatus Entotheonella palauensis]|nr:c-type cytochrome [Candidatus Entotheonella palauensis]
MGLAWLLIPLAVAAGQDNNKMAQDNGSIGRQLYERYCSACHGMDGQGQGPVAFDLRTEPADLTQIAKRRGGKFPVAEIAAFIDGRADVRAHGSRDMPVWGERFGEQVGGGSLGEEVVRGNLLVLIQYLQSLQQ